MRYINLPFLFPIIPELCLGAVPYNFTQASLNDLCLSLNSSECQQILQVRQQVKPSHLSNLNFPPLPDLEKVIFSIEATHCLLTAANFRNVDLSNQMLPVILRKLELGVLWKYNEKNVRRLS